MPFFTFLAGAAGFYLRLTELMNVFDASTGLPRRGAGITYALIALSVVFLIIVLVFAIRATTKYKAQSGFENAFGTDPVAYPIAFSVIGLVWLAATVKYFFDLNMPWPIPVVDMIFITLSVLSAFSMALFAIEMYQDPFRKSKFVLSIVPSMFTCFWLIVLYRQNASNPILLSYCYQCLAIITSALGFYFTSGFVYNKPAPGKAIFSYFAAAYFCFVTLADKHTLSIRFIFAIFIVINFVQASMLIRNLRRNNA